MTPELVAKLPLGLYRIYWDSGGSSLAAVGNSPDGRRWMAPINWVSGSSTEHWESVLFVRPVSAPSEEEVAIEPEALDISLQTTFNDYVRNEGPVAENAGAFSDWMEDLTRVGATIHNEWCNSIDTEVDFELTLEQAFRLGWLWDGEGPPEEYLAEKIFLKNGWSTADNSLALAAQQIRALWEQWKSDQPAPV